MSDDKSGGNGQSEASIPNALDALATERAELAGEQLASAAVGVAKRGVRFALASLASASPDLMHQAVRASIPSGWRVTLPTLDVFTADQWRLILAWLSLRFVMGKDAGLLEAIREIEADEKAKASASRVAVRTPR